MEKIAETGLIAHFDMGEEGEKYQGRAEDAKFRALPVLGWQAARKEGATSEHGVIMRVVTNRLGEIIKLSWSCRRKEKDDKVEQRRNHIRVMCSHLGRYIARACRNGHLHSGWLHRASQIRDWGWTHDVEDQIEVMSAATWSAEARVGAEAEEEQAKWRRIQSWTLWAKRACEGGASNGHQWINGPR